MSVKNGAKGSSYRYLAQSEDVAGINAMSIPSQHSIAKDMRHHNSMSLRIFTVNHRLESSAQACILLAMTQHT
jgi:hypothetical protein